MTHYKSGSIILLSCLLFMFSSARVPLLSALHPSDYQSLIVSVESPRADREYGLGEIVPVRVTVANIDSSAIRNTTILGTTNWDMQFVHVPLLEVTHANQSEVAVYAPNPNTQIPQGGLEISHEALISFNNQGFLRLPASQGDWLLTLEIDPHSPYYSVYEARITIHVRPPTPISLYFVVAGWVCVIVVGVIILRRKKLRKASITPS